MAKTTNTAAGVYGPVEYTSYTPRNETFWVEDPYKFRGLKNSTAIPDRSLRLTTNIPPHIPLCGICGKPVVSMTMSFSTSDGAIHFEFKCNCSGQCSTFNLTISSYNAASITDLWPYQIQPYILMKDHYENSRPKALNEIPEIEIDDDHRW